MQKKTTRKMLNIPFCAYVRADLDDLLAVGDRGLLDALELDVRLDELDRAVGAGGDGLHAGAGEPVDDRAARDEAEEERRVEQRQLLDLVGVGEPVGEEHDDREDHRGRPDDGRADEHGLRRGLEGVARAVVLLEEVLGLLEVDVEAELLLDVLP